jgi:predicted O-linked N-acetylglucosamine transferase (SPINDLY family)
MSDSLSHAIQLHQQGFLPQVREAYLAILAAESRNADAHQFLGMLEHQAGRAETALRHFETAVSLDPGKGFYHVNFGNLLKDLGRPQEAEAAYRRALEIHPGDAIALHNLGHLYQKWSRWPEAREALEAATRVDPGFLEAWSKLAAVNLRMDNATAAMEASNRVIALDPNHASGWFHKADALGRQEKWQESRLALEKALALKPVFPEAHNNLGLARKFLGDLEGAADAFRTAMAQDPSFAEPCCNLGQMALDRHEHDEAFGWFRRALELDPNSSQTHFGMGNFLNAVGRYDDAASHLRKALEIRPNFPEALNNLGNILLSLRRHDEGLDAFQKAIRIRPDFHEAFANMGNLQREAKFPDLAEASMLEAIRLKPGFAAAHSNLGNAYFDQGKVDLALASYRKGIDLGQDDRDFVPNYLFALNYSPSSTDADIASEHRRLCREKFDHLRDHSPLANTRDPDRKIRVGYVSPDFWMHPVARFMLPILEHHDRKRFEVFAYSSRYLKDGFTEECARRVDHWRESHHLDDKSLAAQIRRDGIDILVDLTMHSRDCRPGLFARKPAPLQVSYLAYVGTTGLEAMDYRITDIFLDPPGGPDLPFPEKPLRLERSWWTFQPPVRTNISDVVPPPCLENGFVTFGSLNNFVKVNEPVRDLWARLVAVTPGARLMIHMKESRARQGLLQFLADRGLPPERVTLVGYQDGPAYMATYGQMDIALDPSPFAGGTTTFDALWMGVPVVSHAGDRSSSRGGLGILATLGRRDWVASTPDEYIAIARRLAADPGALSSIRKGLRDELRASPLMDNKGFTRELEAQFESIWRDWCRG